MKIGDYELDNSHTHVMGILNITPDSFSDGGQYNTIDQALIRAQQMLQDGATILDIGGESTRPGYTHISEQEEIERVCPVIERLKKEIDLPISVDTYHAAVAKEAIVAGVDLINDIWGLCHDEQMAAVISENKVACCLMHNRANMDYNAFEEDILSDMRHIINIALNAKIEPSKIIMDPGVGFAKDTQMNLKTLQMIPQFQELGYPVLIGASRKSVIGNTLNLPVTERMEGTLAITALSAMQGAFMVRVHDVKENVRVVRMIEAIKNS